CFFHTSILRTTVSTLFPYTTLFRSRRGSTQGRVIVRRSRFMSPPPSKHQSLARPDALAGQLEMHPASACSASYPRCVASSCSERSEEHTSELQSRENLVCRLLLEKK